MSYTPGPWEFIKAPKQNIIIGCKERGIAIIPNDDKKIEETKLANARLIAAAPELLDVAEMLWDLIISTDGVADNGEIKPWQTETKGLAIVNAVNAAIKKAKGESAEWHR